MQRFGRNTSSAAAPRAEGATAAAGWGGGYCGGVLGGRWALYLFDRRSCHGHRQNELKSILWGGVPRLKQLSGLHWQNEYRRRPISEGTGPSMKSHSQPGDWTLRLSLLSWFIARSVKKSPNWRNRAMHKSTINRQAICLNLSSN